VLIELWPVKGGVGTSVIAATLAATLPEVGESVLIVTRNKEEMHDQAAIWGVSPVQIERWDQPYPLATLRHQGDDFKTSPISISCTWFNTWHAPRPYEEQFDHTIIIRTPQMQATASMIPDYEESTKIQIVENSYVCLARSTRSANRYDATIVFTTEGGPLEIRDCKAVLADVGGIIFEWKRDPGIQRAIDAGLYTGRIPRLANQSFNEITNHIKELHSHASNH